jgi:hypothetical protein
MKRPITRVWQKWRSGAPQTHLRLIKVWFSASIPKAIGMVKIATFAKPENVSTHFDKHINDIFIHPYIII